MKRVTDRASAAEGLPENSGEYHHQSDVRPEYLALGFLAGENLHGYELYCRFESELGKIWHLSQSQMYSLLKRLEVQGLVEEVNAPSRPRAAAAKRVAGRNSKRALSLTDLGRARLADWLEAPTDCSSRIMRLEFIARLYFAGKDRPDLVPTIVAGQRAALLRQVANHEALLAALPEGDRFNRLGYRFRVTQLNGLLAWLEDDVVPLMR